MAKLLSILSIFILSAVQLIGQIPQDLPSKSSPVEFDVWWKYPLYIGLPIVMVVYFLYVNRRKKDK